MFRRMCASRSCFSSIGEGDPHTNVESLRNLPNLHCVGPRDYRQLPAYLNVLRHWPESVLKINNGPAADAPDIGDESLWAVLRCQFTK